MLNFERPDILLAKTSGEANETLNEYFQTQLLITARLEITFTCPDDLWGREGSFEFSFHQR